MTTLEREFEYWKIMHKSSVIKAVALKYYTDLEETSVNLPKFMDEDYKTPEEKASDYLLEIANDSKKFDKTYEKCWQRVARYLP